VNIKKLIFCSLLILLIFNIFDTFSTHYIITEKGGMELNPAMGWLMDKLGIIQAMLLWKGLALLFLFLMLLVEMSEKQMKMFLGLSILTNFIYIICLYTVNYKMFL
jgi:hypothetical protein